jgi:hypothetical protein
MNWDRNAGKTEKDGKTRIKKMDKTEGQRGREKMEL